MSKIECEMMERIEIFVFRMRKNTSSCLIVKAFNHRRTKRQLMTIKCEELKLSSNLRFISSLQADFICRKIRQSTNNFTTINHTIIISFRPSFNIFFFSSCSYIYTFPYFIFLHFNFTTFFSTFFLFAISIF